MFTTDDLEKSVKAIAIDGFTWNKEIMGFTWTNIKDDRVERIAIGYRGYPGGFYMYTPHVTITFNDVENIFTILHGKYETKQRFGDYTIQAQLGTTEGIAFEIFDTEIVSSETFHIVAIEIKKLIDKGARPFLERYKTLRDVFDESENMEIKKMAKFIGQPLPFRRMIIKKLCNDFGYDEYYRSVVNFYKSGKLQDDVILAEQLNEILQQVSK